MRISLIFLVTLIGCFGCQSKSSTRIMRVEFQEANKLYEGSPVYGNGSKIGFVHSLTLLPNMRVLAELHVNSNIAVTRADGVILFRLDPLGGWGIKIASGNSADPQEIQAIDTVKGIIDDRLPTTTIDSTEYRFIMDSILHVKDR